MLDQGGDVPSAGALIPNGMPNMDGFLSDFARENPRLAWMTQMIAAQRQAAAAAPPPSAADDHEREIEELRHLLARAEAQTGKLLRHLRRLTSELETADERLADLASAFGACGLCWGQDDECLSCRGHGKPGMFAPDEKLRLRFFAEPIALPPMPNSHSQLSSQNQRR